MKPFFVYLLKCSDGSYYGGQTDDMAARMFQHDAGEIGYTSTRKPVELVWQGEFETREGAIAFERQIKGWSRAKKEALIRGDWTAVQRHAWETRNPLPAHLAGDGPSIPQGERSWGGAEADVQGGKQVTSHFAVASEPDLPRSNTTPGLPEFAPARPESTPVRPESAPVRPEVSKGSSGSGENLRLNLLGNEVGHKLELQRRAQRNELPTAPLSHTGKAMHLSLQPVLAGDFEDMLALRIDAMRPSLERVGRFDLARSRERLAAGFVPPYMQHILLDGERVGFFTLKPEGDTALRLDHLYLRSGASGQGVGTWVLRQVLAQARERGLAVRLTALRESDANRFYLRHGFVLQGEEGVDLHYEWRAVERVA